MLQLAGIVPKESIVNLFLLIMKPPEGNAMVVEPVNNVKSLGHHNEKVNVEG